MMENRLNKLRGQFAPNGIDAILVTAPENRYYLSGFTGTAAILFITSQKAYLITDFRYTEQAKKQSPNFEVIEQGYPLEDTIKEIINNTGSQKIGLEKDHITYSQFEFYQDKLALATWVPLKNIMEKQRMVKDQEEIYCLRKAVKLADEAYAHILDYLKPGATELEISLELEFFMRRQGAEKAAFDFIVASGERSSMPHGVATTKKIKSGELVTMDYGCVYEGYHSDITRTPVVGKADQKQQDIYRIVLEAQMAAIDSVHPGIPGSAVDKVARDIISRYGYGENFGHSLGHSVGLEIHERPSFSVNENTLLQEGMTITVEPGIYLPGWGGVRIEDIVLVTDHGCEVLTRADKALWQL